MTNGTVRNFTYYFKGMLKFYDLKAQGIPQMLFVLLLATTFGFRLLMQPMVMDMSIYQQQLMISYEDILSQGAMTDPGVMDSLMKIPFSEEYVHFITAMLKILGLFLVQQILLMLFAFFYLAAFLVDQETQKPILAQYAGKCLKALPRYIGFNILFFLGMGFLFGIFIVFSSVMMMILPITMILLFMLPVLWFLIQVIFVFKDITLLDTRVVILKNFRLSWKLSARNRVMIGWNLFFIMFLNLITSMVGVGTHVRLSIFLVSFFEVIVLLVHQRLITLMYMDRTRIKKEEPGED